MPKKIEIDQLLIKDTQLKDYDSLFIFSDFNPEMKNDKFKQIFPYNRTDVVRIRGVKVMSGKKLELSINPYMFKDVKLNLQ